MKKNIFRPSIGGLALILLLTCPLSTAHARDEEGSFSSEGISQGLLLDEPDLVSEEGGEGFEMSDLKLAPPATQKKGEVKGKNDKQKEEKPKKDPLHPTKPQAIRTFRSGKVQGKQLWRLGKSDEPSNIIIKEDGHISMNGSIVKVGGRYTYKEGSLIGPIKNGWVRLGGKSYYADKEGYLYTDTLLKVGNKSYYFGPEGYSLSGIQEVGGKYYYFDEENNNAMIKGKITLTRGGNTYVLNEDGSFATNTRLSFVQSTDSRGRLEILPKKKDGAMLVIDISKYQRPEDIDYDLLCRHISGVILRVAHSWQNRKVLAPNEDPTFKTHYNEFRKRGIPVGCYYFSTAVNYDEGVKEAEKTMEILANRKLQLPVYWDSEDQYKQAKIPASQLTQAAKGFLETMTKNGYVAGVYASSSWLKHRLNMEDLQEYETWVAHYGRGSNGRIINLTGPNYNRSYEMWQMESNGRIPGHAGVLDINWMYKDYPSIIGNHPR